MAHRGRDVVNVGSPKVGQKYVFGAKVPLDNPNWKGPWDCAEFASWCAFQAYGIIFGASPKKLPKAEPYSGFWYDDAKKLGTVITWQQALGIPGAAVIRRPVTGKIGHVAFSLGDNDRTLEARGAAFGVGVFSGAKSRSWSIGCLLPGVDYGSVPVGPSPATPSAPSAGNLWLKSPNFKGSSVLTLQKALAAQGIDPGPLDGEFGPMTDAAVVSFQIVAGLEVDGVVGPATAKALGLAFPIP